MQPGYQTIFASISSMAALGCLLKMMLGLANSTTGDKGACGSCTSPQIRSPQWGS